jgi:hypothetical protein
MSMGMSFFTSCPLIGGLSVPLQTVCTSNSSLSLRDFVRVSFDFAQDHELVEWHLFEAASRLVFVRPALARTPGIVSVYGIVSHFGAIYLCCIIQVWARGMVKKRHLHALFNI